MSAFEEYKKKMKTARPWHLLDSKNYTDEQVSSARYEICLACPELIDLTKQLTFSTLFNRSLLRV